MKQAELKRISDQYAAFAADEAPGSSETYERLAFAVSQSDDLLEFIATLPVERRQPNLLLAAVRHVCGIARNVDDLGQFVQTNHGQIREVSCRGRHRPTNLLGAQCCSHYWRNVRNRSP